MLHHKSIVKTLFLFSILLCITNNTHAQVGFVQKLPDEELIPADANNPNLPDWAQEMYAPRPNFNKVAQLYRAYYAIHPLEKNVHTRYYMRWMHKYQHLTNDSGYVVLPTTAESQQFEHTYLSEKQQSPNRFGPGSSWTCIGPFDFDKDASGRSHAPGSAHVYTLERSASNPDIMLAGTATAGLWKTTDHGLNWTLLTRDMMVKSVRAVEIQYNNPDVMYFGGNGKIYKSTDGGTTWNITGQSNFTNINHTVYSIVMQPGYSNKLFASTNYGLYVTLDGGNNWNQVINAPGSGEYIGDIELHPTDTNVVYAIYNAVLVGATNKYTSFYRSTDAGTSFVSLSSWPSNATTITGADHQRRTEIAVTPAAPDRIYAILTGSANGGEGLYGIYRSDDRGDTWTHLCCGAGPGGLASTSNINVMGYDTDGSDDGGQYYYDLAIDADKVNPNKVHVAGIMHWVSTDGGANFTCTNSWSNPSGDLYVHADIHDIRIYENEVWIACDGGIFLSTDSGLVTFNRRQYGIAGTDFWGYGAGFKDGNVMLGGTYHNSHLLKNNNVYDNGWISYTGSADGYRGFVNPGNNKWVYNDSRKDLLPLTRTEPFINFPFDQVPNADYVLGFSCPLAWNPFCYSHVYSGVDGTLWKSENDGITWTSIHDFGNGKITDLEIAFDNPQRLYAVYTPTSGARKMYRSDDDGLTWIDITAPTSIIGSNTGRQIDITVDEHNSSVVWFALLSSSTATDNYKVFKSTDAGVTWSNYSSAILNGHTMQSIVHQRGTDGGVYVGTDKAVFYRNNGMTEWELYSEQLPASTSCFKLVPWYKGGKLRNGSDRSVYEVDLYELAAPKAQFTSDKLYSGCSRDTFYLSDYSSVYGNATFTWQITPAPQYISSTSTETIKVVFGSTGSYSVSLNVSDSLGSDAISANNIITVANECDADTIPGNALLINADGQYASATSSLNLNTNAVTLSAWIKPENNQPQWAGIMFFRGGSTTTGLGFNANNMQLSYHYDGNNWSWAGGPYVAPDEWSHVALVIYPDSAFIYLNGNGTKRITSHPAEAFDAPLIIGNDPHSDARTFRGLIDEVCVYNRSLSRDEIRELMHLTKKPALDSTLKTYIQFNEGTGDAYDKAGLSHVGLAGGAVRTSSSGPFGGGKSERFIINNPGSFPSTSTGIELNFASGILPMGDVWVTRINLLPDVPAAVAPLNAPTYWVLENHASNFTFDELQSIAFERTGINLPACNDHKLFIRGPRADGPQWLIADSADICTGSLPNDRKEFTSGNDVIESLQLTIAKAGQSPTPVIDKKWMLPEALIIGPNPTHAGESLHIQTKYINGQYSLFDSGGRQLETKEFTGGNFIIQTNEWSAGIYTLELRSGKIGLRKKLIIYK